MFCAVDQRPKMRIYGTHFLYGSWEINGNGRWGVVDGS